MPEKTKLKHLGSRRTFEVTEIKAMVKCWKTGGCYAQMPRSWIGKKVMCIDMLADDPLHPENIAMTFTVKGGKTGPGYVSISCDMKSRSLKFRLF